MQIEAVNIYRVKLPFTGDFSHALKTERFARSLIVEIVAQNGSLAYGEGAPRAYVTGESSHQALVGARRIIEHFSFPWQLIHLGQVWEMLDHFSDSKDHHAALCAVETALLDAVAQSRHQPLRRLFDESYAAERVKYGAGIPLTHPERSLELCRRIASLKIDRLKLKLGDDLEKNQNAIELIRRTLGPLIDLKVDPNGAWDLDTARRHLPLLLSAGIRIVEQPLPPHDPDIECLSREYHSAGLLLMADESACTTDEVRDLVDRDLYRMFNIRLSKCGGFRNSLEMIDFLRKRNVAYQIGCHLGESGILSAAGRQLSLLCRDARYTDGSYDAFMLKENLTTEHVSFGTGGLAEPLPGNGLAVEVDPLKLKRLSEEVIRLSPPRLQRVGTPHSR